LAFHALACYLLVWVVMEQVVQLGGGRSRGSAMAKQMIVNLLLGFGVGLIVMIGIALVIG